MAYSYVQYVGNGSSVTYAVTFPYLSTSHVEVRVNNVLKTQGVDYTWTTSSTITFTTAPANGITVDIRRKSSPSTRLVDFQDGSTLTQDVLDTDSNQNFFLAQEAVDAVDQRLPLDTDGQWDTNNRRIKNVAEPINNQDAATKYYVNNAAGSQVVQAAASASNAASSATDASTSAAAAANSATLAATKATEASTSAATATTKATEASNSAASALTIFGNVTAMNAAVTSVQNNANTASTAATTATTKASDAATSATNAANSANAAASSATSAASSATTSTNQASTATTKATEAATSATNAAASASSASTSASTATTKATEAATSATNAASSLSSALSIYGSISAVNTAATSASNSATSAASSASTATTKASDAASSASNAATSATNAATSATASASSATLASTKAADAATSATNAATSATASAASATLASTKASDAATSATNAATSAANALDSKNSASTYATNSSNSATNSATSAALAQNWATKTSSEVVTGQGYGAKKYADDAASSASLAASYATTGNVATVAANITDINTVAADITNIDAIASNSSNINAVAGISSNVTTVATNNANVTTCAANITAINAAPTSAANAATSATLAQDWATKTTGEVVVGQGYGAKYYSQQASASASGASTSATNASNSASTAAGYASAAAGYLAPVTSTSTTSLTIGSGSKSLTTDTGKSYVAGHPVKIADVSAPSTNYMSGIVSSYNSSTGAMVVAVDTTVGSGTISNWQLSITYVNTGGGGSAGTPVGGVIQLPYGDPTVSIGTQSWQRANTGGIYARLSYNASIHELSLLPAATKDYWTGITSPFASNAKAIDVISTGSGFAAVANSSTANDQFSTSSDGITWNSPTTINTSFSPALLHYVNETYFAFAQSGGAAAYSTDGVTWTYTSTGQPFNILGMLWTGTYYVGTNTSSVYYSSNRTTWTTVSGSGGYTLNKVGSTYVITTAVSGVARTSSDGVTWTNQSIATTSEGFYSAASDGTTLVTVGSSGSVYTTTDGVTWTYRTLLMDRTVVRNRLISTATGVFYLFGSQAAFKSTDSGVTWTIIGKAPFNNNNPLAFYNNTFVSTTANDITTTGNTGMAYTTNMFTGTPEYIHPIVVGAPPSGYVYSYMRTK